MNISFNLLQKFIFVFILITPALADIPTVDSQGNELPTLAPLVKKVTPAVVNVATRTTQHVDNPLLSDPFFSRFF